MVVVKLRLWLVSPIMLVKLMMNVNVIACECVCDWDKGMVALGCYAQAPIPALDTRWNGPGLKPWYVYWSLRPGQCHSTSWKSEWERDTCSRHSRSMETCSNRGCSMLPHRGDRDNWIMRIWWGLSREGDGRGKSQGPKQTMFVKY